MPRTRTRTHQIKANSAIYLIDMLSIIAITYRTIGLAFVYYFYAVRRHS